MASDEAMHDGERISERADTIDLKTGPHTHEQEEPKTGRYWCGEATRYILWAAFLFGMALELCGYFMYKTKWGIDFDAKSAKDFDVHGIFWPGKGKRFRINIACWGLVVAATACVLLEELLVRRHAHADADAMYSVGRALTTRVKVWGNSTVHWWLGPDASVVGTIAMLLVVACICSWHVLGVSSELRKRNGDEGPEGQAVGWKVWNARSHNIGTHRALKTHALWFGLDAMVTLSLIGIPTARVSAMFRAIGLPYEAAIAYHRWLGHLTLLLLTLHFVMYGAAFVLIGGGGWNKRGRENLGDELLMGCHKGERITRTGVTRVFRNDCNGVNNFAGVLAWVVGMFMWIFALPWVRRRSYDLFISTHQFHWAFWFLSCCHYTTIVDYAMPSMVFYIGDLAHRRYRTSWPVECGLRAHVGDGGASMTTVAVPLPPSRPPSKCPVARGREAVPDDCTAAVVHLKSYALSAFRRKPFTVAGSFHAADGRRFGLVHIFDAGGDGFPYDPWTRRLGAIADGADHAKLVVRGPLPHPAVEYDAARDAAKGTPTLLVGAGSGQTPAIAFLRKVKEFRTMHVAHGGKVDDATPTVRFVLVVRHQVLLECAEAWMLPRDDAGTTGAPWLRTEIHVTRATAPGKALAVIPRVDDAWAGPVEVHRDGDGSLVGVATGWPEPPADPDAVAKVDAERGDVLEADGRATTFGVDEAVALWGAFVGYLFTGQGLGWQKKDHGPFAEEHDKAFLQPKREGNPNMVSGGFLFVACCLAALVGAVVLVALADLVRFLFKHPEDRRRVEPTRAPAEASCVRIALKSDGARPDLEEIVARADAELGAHAHVLGGGPPALLERLNGHLGNWRFAHRLTYSM